MSTKQRLEYFMSMPQKEWSIRSRITRERNALKAAKDLLKTWISYRDAEENSDLIHLIDGSLKLIRDEISVHKFIIHLLKQGLPQRRPAGVMAKCPFCGATQKDVVTKVMFNGTVEIVPALDAHCNDVFKAVAAECLNCGHRIDNWHTEDVQKVIDTWNRRK